LVAVVVEQDLQALAQMQLATLAVTVALAVVVVGLEAH
jgi:hypothetical protein